MQKTKSVAALACLCAGSVWFLLADIQVQLSNTQCLPGDRIECTWSAGSCYRKGSFGGSPCRPPCAFQYSYIRQSDGASCDVSECCHQSTTVNDQCSAFTGSVFYQVETCILPPPCEYCTQDNQCQGSSGSPYSWCQNNCTCLAGSRLLHAPYVTVSRAFLGLCRDSEESNTME